MSVLRNWFVWFSNLTPYPPLRWRRGGIASALQLLHTLQDTGFLTGHRVCRWHHKSSALSAGGEGWDVVE